MPAADKILDAVKSALVKNGGTITDDPYVIQYEDATLFADLGAERRLAAERAGRKIVVEVKSFLHPSPIHDFQSALGQYEMYRTLLKLTEPDRQLYLAIGDVIYADIFGRKSIQVIVQERQLALLVVNLDTEEVTQWIS
jgi:hypothetical protein